MGYVIVSAKVPRKLKELLDEYGIKPGSIIREALGREARRRMLEEAEREARELSNKVNHILDEEIARLIREDR